MSVNKSFRYDINGLRAWAVLAVVFFHFKIPGFSGGFVGVDVFFVISGYLMTGIIVRGLYDKSSDSLSPGGFSLSQFYLARARRIIPALAFLCLFLLVVGWFLLAPRDYRELGRETARAILFVSNFLYLSQDGYFDSSSLEKMLLHSWSLSVEWQFYILLPLLLVCVARFFKCLQFIKLTLLLIFFSSLLASIYISYTNQSAAFFMLYTRAWEMMAGGLVSVFVTHQMFSDRTRKLLSSAGLLLIALSIVFFDGADVWPGAYAIIPVLGAALVIIANNQRSVFLNPIALQKTGDWSYSLYLWHWPLMVALVYTELTDNYLIVTVCIVLSILLGYLSYRWVETPFRVGLTKKSKTLNTVLFLLIVVFVFSLGSQVRRKHGYPDRLPEQVRQVFEEKNYNPRLSQCNFKIDGKYPECTYGGEQLGVIVLGDSHGAAIVRSFEKALPDSNTHHVLDWTLSGCPTIKDVKHKSSDTYDCSEFIDKVLSDAPGIDPKVPLVIANRLAAYVVGPNEVDRVDELENPPLYISKKYQERNLEYYDEFFNGAIAVACELAQYRPVYMLRPTPELVHHVPRTMGRRLLYKGSLESVEISLQDHLDRNHLVIEMQNKAAKQCGIKLLETTPYLCPDGVCKGDKDGIPIYFDDDHLNLIGSDLLLPEFRKVFKGD